jgi:endonuclease YncB( thermonuclease family)
MRRHGLSLSAVLFAIAVPMPVLAAPTPMREVTVVHVDDGDTIDVRLDDRIERVRYIGVDAPEIPHDGIGGARGGEAATRLNEALVGGRRVRLQLDREERDRYGRLLAYLWVGNTMINLEMVRRGYARVLTIPPNVHYQRWFLSVEAEARAAHLGLWRGPPAGTGDAGDEPARGVRDTGSSGSSPSQRVGRSTACAVPRSTGRVVPPARNERVIVLVEVGTYPPARPPPSRCARTFWTRTAS